MSKASAKPIASRPEPARAIETDVPSGLQSFTRLASSAAIAGLGPSAAPLFFRVRPRGAPPPQYAARPAPGEPPLVLTYFAIRGLGETVRLLLAEAAVPHDHLAVVGGEPMALAAECCGSRLVSLFEGGYKPKPLSACARAHVAALCGQLFFLRRGLRRLRCRVSAAGFWLHQPSGEPE